MSKVVPLPPRDPREQIQWDIVGAGNLHCGDRYQVAHERNGRRLMLRLGVPMKDAGGVVEPNKTHWKFQTELAPAEVNQLLGALLLGAQFAEQATLNAFAHMLSRGVQQPAADPVESRQDPSESDEPAAAES